MRARLSRATGPRSSRASRSRRPGSSRSWRRRSIQENSTIAHFERVEGIRLRFTVGDPQSFWRRPGDSRFVVRRACWAGSGPGAVRGSSSGSSRRSHRWPPRSFWASARESSPRSTMPSRGPARLTCSRSRGFSCRPWRSRSCWYFGSPGWLVGRPTLCVCLAMVAYAVVVGPAPSVVRATVMTATFCLASISRRRRAARQYTCRWPRSALWPSIRRISSMSAASFRSWRSAH